MQLLLHTKMWLLLTFTAGSLFHWLHAYSTGAGFYARRCLAPTVICRAARWGLVDLCVVAGLFIFVEATIHYGFMWAEASWSQEPAVVAHLDTAGSAASPVEGAAIQHANRLAWRKLAGGLGRVAAIVLMVLWLKFRYRSHTDELGVVPGLWRNDLRLGLVAGLMLIPPVLFLHQWLASIWTYEHPTQQLMGAAPQLSIMIAAIISSGIAAPLFEEFVFRLLLISWLNRFFASARPFANDTSQRQSSRLDQDPTWSHKDRFTGLVLGWRAWVPVLIAATLFSLAHFSQGPAPIALFVLGISLGMLYQWTGRILPGLIVHLLLNGWSLGFTVAHLIASA